MIFNTGLCCPLAMQHWFILVNRFQTSHGTLQLTGWGGCWLLAASTKFSFHTNLQTALDKVEGHHCCVCEAAAQDAPKATQGIVLWGAKLAADILCGRREGTQHACHMQGHMQHRTKSTPIQSYIMEELSLWGRKVPPRQTCGLFELSVRSLPL